MPVSSSLLGGSTIACIKITPDFSGTKHELLRRKMTSTRAADRGKRATGAGINPCSIYINIFK